MHVYYMVNTLIWSRVCGVVAQLISCKKTVLAIYISGFQLVINYNRSLFQVLNENANENVGSIVIQEAGLNQDPKRDQGIQEKKYQ